jgi:hypothetical protein
MILPDSDNTERISEGVSDASEPTSEGDSDTSEDALLV